MKSGGAYPHGMMMQYLDRPEGLPEVMFNHAYSDGLPKDLTVEFSNVVKSHVTHVNHKTSLCACIHGLAHASPTTYAVNGADSAGSTQALTGSRGTSSEAAAFKDCGVLSIVWAKGGGKTALIGA